VLTFRRNLIVAVLFLGVFTLPMSAAPAKAEDVGKGAEKFISNMADQAINALTTPGIDAEERSERFRKLLNENFAVNTIGRWVLGRYWNKASKVEKKEYLQLFEQMLISTYVDRFSKYSGEQLKILKSLPNGKSDAVVYSEIVRTNSEPSIHVDWRVRSKKDTYKIIDVMVEGVSMGQTQRSEFASVIRQNGGKLEGLLKELRKRVSKSA